MTNTDFEKLVDTSDEWITSRTGIKERRVAEDGCAGSDMAVAALRSALAMAETEAGELEVLILGTVTPDYQLPSSACVVQEKMDLGHAVAFDVVSACTGFINGLAVARAYIESGMYRKVGVIGVEKLSSVINYRDRNTCVLFGDGAGAAVVCAGNGDRGVLSTFMRSDGRMRKLLWIKAGGTVNPIAPGFAFDGSDKIAMCGSEVFKVAVREMCNASQTVMDEAGVSGSDLALVVPHQANIRIVEAFAKRLGVSMDRVKMNIEKYGNTSAAAVPIALDEAHREGRIKPGDLVLMVAFGGGLIWGAALVRW